MTNTVDPKPVESSIEVKYLTQEEFDKEWAKLFPIKEDKVIHNLSTDI